MIHIKKKKSLKKIWKHVSCDFLDVSVQVFFRLSIQIFTDNLDNGHQIDNN